MCTVECTCHKRLWRSPQLSDCLFTRLNASICMVKANGLYTAYICALV